MSDNKIPPKTKERYIILDALRGFALFGICLANYSEFSLYSFQSSGTIVCSLSSSKGTYDLHSKEK